MVASIGADGEGLVRTGVNRYRAGRIYCSVGIGAGGDGEGINGEAGSDGVVSGNVGEGVAGYRSFRDVIDLHITDMVAGMRGDGEGLVSTVVNHHVAGRRYRATDTGAGGDELTNASICLP